MLAMIKSGRLSPEKLLGRTINLEESIATLTNIDKINPPSVTVVTHF
jgi:alcohol dehydrogenase